MYRQLHDGAKLPLGESADASEELIPPALNEDLASDLEAPVDEEVANVLSEEAALDTITHYLREIGRVQLLSAAEEVELGERIARGTAAAQRLTTSETLSLPLRTALAADVADGQEAWRQLIQANLRLVVSIARKYIGRGLALLDLIQEGNLGLMRAVEKFDATRGHRFSTYATWWIRQGITRALAEQSRTIRLPVYLSDSVGQVARTIQKLAQALGRQPTIAEIASALDQSVDWVEQVLAAARQPISLQTPVGEEGEQTLGDIVSNERQPSVSDLATQQLLRRDLAAALDQLSERERRIIQLHYGLIDGQRHTLAEVGRLLGMSRERARQIEAEALGRLRSLEVGRHLREYLE
jgi:RNA polymerase primary sigma factor